MGEFKQIQEILSKIGTEIFKIDEEMTEKNETEDGNSISLKSPWHMKWDRQQFLPFFPVAEIGSIMHLLYFSYPQEIWAQFVEWGKKVLSPYSPQWSVYFSISLLQIAGKHPVYLMIFLWLPGQEIIYSKPHVNDKKTPTGACLTTTAQYFHYN